MRKLLIILLLLKTGVLQGFGQSIVTDSFGLQWSLADTVTGIYELRGFDSTSIDTVIATSEFNFYEKFYLNHIGIIQSANDYNTENIANVRLLQKNENLQIEIAFDDLNNLVNHYYSIARVIDNELKRTSREDRVN